MSNWKNTNKFTNGSSTQKKMFNMNKQTPELILIGFYYKSLDDDGFCISVNKTWKPELFDFFSKGYYSIKQEWERQISEMKSGKFYGTFEELLKKTIKFEKESLKEEISNWYKLNGFSNGIQPLEIPFVEWEISTRTIPTLSKILRSIYILTEVGVIENDNYNGLNFMYSQTEQLKQVS